MAAQLSRFRRSSLVGLSALFLACTSTDDAQNTGGGGGGPAVAAGGADGTHSGTPSGGGGIADAAPAPDDVAQLNRDSARREGSSPAFSNLPLLSPPVRQAAPLSLGGVGAHAQAGGPDASFSTQSGEITPFDLDQRFFQQGPTSIYRILGDIDARIDEINRRSSGAFVACLAGPAVAYDLQIVGESVTFYAQCFLSGPPGSGSFVQFGQHEGSTYLYSRSTVGPVAARLDPAPDAAASTGVHAFIGIADGRTTGGSYGIIELRADPARRELELSVAGLGFGYCGEQLKTDGVGVFANGSSDMGTTCNTNITHCRSAEDLTASAMCAPPLTDFGLPKLGRLAITNSFGTFGESQYPGGADNHVILDGSSRDSVDFGPSAPSPGVAEFTTERDAAP